MSETITVRYNSRPVITRIMKDERNEIDPDAAVDINGWTIKLIVKQDRNLPDARAWFDLSASLISVTDGTYKFELTEEHTCLPPGTWPGEIRWWKALSYVPPDDAIQVNFVVEDVVDGAGAN